MQLDLGLNGNNIRDASPGIGSRTAAVGIAGVNTRPLMRAADPLIGIAGNWGSTLRPHVGCVVDPGASINKSRLGDQAAIDASKRACYFFDYTYIACPDRRGGRMRYRPGFAELCATATRPLPVFLDSAAYREFTGGAPSWSSYSRYCETIDLVRPDGAMAKDTVGNQDASRLGYERMCRDGYRDPGLADHAVVGERPVSRGQCLARRARPRPTVLL